MDLDKIAFIMSLINKGNGTNGENVNLSDYYTKLQTDVRIAERIAEIVADAPKDFDTLKELSDWIASHEDSAAAMNSAIAANATAIDTKADKTTTYTKTEVNSALSNKVDKISGKGLSTNDFTNAYKSKLDDLKNYDDTEIKADVAEVSSQTALNRSTLGYQRKNLLQNKGTTTTKNGVTFTVNDDRSVTVNGTATVSTWFILSERNTIFAGRYILTSGITDYGNNLMVVISPTLNSGDIILHSAQGAKEISSQDGLIYAIRIQKGFTAENITVYPMLRYAEITDDTYEPYKPSIEEQISNQFDIISSIIDLGAKNIFLDNLGESKTAQGIILLKNNDAYHCEGTPTNPENTFFNLNYVNLNVLSIPKGKYMCLFSSTDTNIGISICFNGAVKVSNKKSNFEFEIPSDATNSWARLQFNTSQIINGDVKIAIIPKAIYDVSPSYQPPAMTNSELTKIIKDLLQSISLLESRVLTLEGGNT